MQFHEKSYAKVNLFLHVLGKLPNGYHQLESLAYFPQNYYDEISVSSGAGQHTLIIEGAFADLLKKVGADIFENNILSKTINIFDTEFNLKTPPLKIILTKNLWVAAGIGGGSSNAAALLRVLNNIHGNKFTLAQLAGVGLKIGADVPVCVYSQPAFFSGVGENIELLENFPEINIELKNPNIAVSTQDVFKMGFKNYSQKIDLKKYDLKTRQGVLEFLSQTKNDLEDNAKIICPEIKDLLAIISAEKSGSENKYLITRMSGSGATCFGLIK